jgi:hypothetical protein
MPHNKNGRPLKGSHQNNYRAQQFYRTSMAAAWPRCNFCGRPLSIDDHGPIHAGCRRERDWRKGGAHD